MFNYHPYLVRDLVSSGMDVVSTANNHSLNRREIGADMTTQAMQENGLRYTGTRPASSQNQGWHAITETNGLPDTNNQVLHR